MASLAALVVGAWGSRGRLQAPRVSGQELATATAEAWQSSRDLQALLAGPRGQR